MSAQRRFDVGWLIVVLLSVFAVAPLTAPGFFLKAHDATIGAYFLQQFDKGIASGALYPRWAIDWTYGYGYPLFVVIAPLAFYAAEVFHLLGAGITDALKIVYALTFILSGLSMYLLGRELYGRAGAILAAMLYAYAPYHLVDIYVRADLAEFASFTFFPAILWALLRLARAETRAEYARYVALGALLYGGLVLTHITMAFIFTPVALLFAAFVPASSHSPISTSSRPRVFASPRLHLLVSLSLGLVIAAAYLIPAFVEQRYLRSADLVGGYYGYANHYVYPSQLLSPFWGYGYAAIGGGDQMPLQLGALAAILAGLSLLVAPRLEGVLRRQLLFFLAMTGLIIFAMLPVSQSLWDVLRPLVSFVQFPWRLLSLASLTLALAGGALGARVLEGAIENRPSRGFGSGGWVETQWESAAPLLILLALLASYTYAVPQYTDGEVSLAKMIQFQIDTKELLGDTMWVTEKPSGSPMVAQYLVGQPPARASAADPQARIDVMHSDAQSYDVAVMAPAATSILFQIRYFPGWHVYVDGKLVTPSIRAPQGIMAVDVPQGAHTVDLHFGDTPLRSASKVVSMLGIAAAVALLLSSRRR